MLLFLLSLFSQYDLINCIENVKVPANFNGTVAKTQLRKSIREIEALLKDVQQEIRKERSVLRAVDYEHASIKDPGFLDYSMTSVWWNGTPGIDQTGRNTPQTSFLPTPDGHGSHTPITAGSTRQYNPPSFTTPEWLIPEIHIPGERPTLIPQDTVNVLPGIDQHPEHRPYPEHPPGRPDPTTLIPGPGSYYTKEDSPTASYITRPSYPFTIPTTTISTEYPPGHPLYVPPPYDSPPPWTSTLTTPGPTERFEFDFTPPTTYQPGSPSIWTGPIYTLFPGLTPEPGMSTLFPAPAPQTYIPTPPPIPTSPKTLPTASTTSTLPPPPMGPPILRSLTSIQDSPSPRAEDIPKPTYSLATMGKYMRIWLNEMTNFTPVEKWLVTFTMQKVTPNYGFTVHQSPQVQRPPKAQDWVHSRQRKNQTTGIYRQGAERESLTTKVKHGQVYLRTTPKQDEHTRSAMVDRRPEHIPVDVPPSASGDVLHEDTSEPPAPPPSPNKPYYDMMEDLDEGFMVVFLLELTRLIALKNQNYVHDVIVHMQTITKELYQASRITWFGHPLVDFALKLGIFLSIGEIEIIRNYAAMLHHMLRERRQMLAADVNSIIEYADLLYDDAEGELLFNTLKEFELYPNVPKTSRQLCDALIENFLRPFQRLFNSERRQALLDSVNYALKTRFPTFSLRAEEENKRLSGAAHEQRSHNTYSKKRRRKRKHRHRTHNEHRLRYRQANHRHKHRQPKNEDIYRRQYTPTIVDFPMLRSLKPITYIQTRFKVITPKRRFRRMKTQTTDAIYSSLVTRPTLEPPRRYRPTTIAQRQFFLEQRTGYDRAYAERFIASAYGGRLQPERYYGDVITEEDVTSIYRHVKKRFDIPEPQNTGSEAPWPEEYIVTREYRDAVVQNRL